MNTSRCSTLFLLIHIITAAGLFSQENGTIRGTVTIGEENARLPGVIASISARHMYATTNANGEFALTPLPAGVIRLEISLVGYKTYVTSVTVIPGKDASVDAHLVSTPFQLDEVVVTGSHQKHLMKDTPVITEVIGQRDLATTGSSDLAEVMRQQTGIDLGTSVGQTQNARLQGLNKNQVLILIDGERTTGKVDDAMDLGQIPVNLIDRIEVVKGPLSSVYGSDALGGVINIITKNPKTSRTFHVMALGGSNGRQDYELSAAHTLENAFGDRYDLSVLANTGYNLYFGIDHYDASNSFDGVPENGRKNADLKISVEDRQNLFIDLKTGYYEDYMMWRGSQFDYYQVKTKATNKKKTLSSSVNYILGENSNIKLSAHYSTNEHGSVQIANTKAQSDVNLSTEELQTYRGQFTFMPYATSVLTLGAERNVEGSISGRVKDGAQTITNDVGYFEDEWTIDPFTLSFGGRYSNNSAFGAFFAPRVSLRYKVTEHLTLRGSYGRGFRAPSFIELYSSFNHSAYGYIVEGNAGLRPESSHGFNFGFDYNRDDLIWFRANFYYNDVANLIDDYLMQKTPTMLYSYKNISQATTKGVDVDFDMQLFTHCALSLGYNYTSAVDGNGVELPSRTPHTVSLKTVYDNPSSGTMVSLRGQWHHSKIVDDQQQNINAVSGQVAVSRIVSPAYATVDTKISQAVSDFTLSAGINNILDKTVFPYGQLRGREFFAGLSFQLP